MLVTGDWESDVGFIFRKVLLGNLQYTYHDFYWKLSYKKNLKDDDMVLLCPIDLIYSKVFKQQKGDLVMCVWEARRRELKLL